MIDGQSFRRQQNAGILLSAPPKQSQPKGIHDMTQPASQPEATADQEQSPCSATFPNPLMIQMGEGKLLCSKFWDHADSDGGIIISDTGERHEIGSDANLPAEENHMPKTGEVFLRFGCKASAESLRDVINEVISEWPSSS